MHAGAEPLCFSLVYGKGDPTKALEADLQQRQGKGGAGRARRRGGCEIGDRRGRGRELGTECVRRVDSLHREQCRARYRRPCVFFFSCWLFDQTAKVGKERERGVAGGKERKYE